MIKRIFVLFLIGAIYFLSLMATVKSQSSELIWNATTALPEPRRQHTSVVWNKRLYVLGGVGPVPEGTQSSVFFANINEDGTVGSWFSTTHLPDSRAAHTTVIYNRFIYVIGGYRSPPDGIVAERNTVWYTQIKADGTLGEWQVTTSLPVQLQRHSTVLWNDRIYVIGGWDGYSTQSAVYFTSINNDGTLNSWQTTTSLPQPTSDGYAVVYNGRVYVIGGHSGVFSPQSRDTVYFAEIRLDGSVGSWQTTSSLPTTLVQFSAVVLDNRIYVIGGRTSGGGSFKDTVYVAKIQSDRRLENWTQITSIPIAASDISSTVSDSTIYLIGGTDSDTSIGLDTVYFSALPTVELPPWMQWWFWTIIGLGITTTVFGLSSLRYRHKLGAQKKTAETTLAKKPQKLTCKICPNCGAQLPADSAFCGKCGTSLK